MPGNHGTLREPAGPDSVGRQIMYHQHVSASWMRRAALPAVLAGLVLLGQFTALPGPAARRGPAARAAEVPMTASAEPGDGVRWLRFPAQKRGDRPAWGPFLNDIENHLPGRYGDRYASADGITHAHETTHAINSHLTNHCNDTGQSAYGFYVGADRAAVIVEPRLKLSQVAAVIPRALRGSRYDLYFIRQQKYFEDRPLYVFDEWTAYVNGARAGIELAERAPGWDSRCDAVLGALEFSVYGLGLALAIKRHDPAYLRTNRQFTEFLAHELRQAADVYRRGIVLDRFRWERGLEVTLLRSADAGEFRALVTELYGPRFTLERLFGTGAELDVAGPPQFVEVRPAPAALATGRIRGTVRDLAERLQPNLKVLLKDDRGRVVAEALTDTNGRFVLNRLEPGAYRVSAAKLGGAKGVTPVQVESGETAQADIVVRH
jgi:hypothetical protein